MKHFYSNEERLKSSERLMAVLKQIAPTDRATIVDYLDIIQADAIMECARVSIASESDRELHAVSKGKAMIAYHLSTIFDDPNLLEVKAYKQPEIEEEE